MAARPEPAGTLWLDSVDSTNEEAKRRAAAGEVGPLWIAARAQTAGRGRRGRAWNSASGNLFCTLLLRPDCDAVRCGELAFAAGLSVADTVARWTDPETVRLKWPNDVLIAGAKVSGCLLETGLDGQGRWLAIGVGLNIVAAPEAPLYPATHLSAHLRPGLTAPSPEAALTALALSFDAWHARWRAEGFAPLRDAFLARAAGLGAPLVARLSDGSERTGVFEDLDPAGALILRLPDTHRTLITAADIFFGRQ